MSEASTHFRDRGALITGLMAGTLDAADAVACTRPAVELLGLLVPVDGLIEEYFSGRDLEGLNVARADFDPWRRQLLAVVAALLERWIGDDPKTWLALAMRAGSHRGSVVELIDSVVHPERADPSAWAGRAPRWPRGVDASAVLLALAPPGIAEAFLEDALTNVAARGILVRMLDRGPLHPLFVDHALGGSGTEAMRRSLIRNPVFEGTLLREHVLRERGDIAVLEESYVAAAADRALRIGLVRLADEIGGFRPEFSTRLESYDADVPALEPLLMSCDAGLVHWVLKRVNTSVSQALRWTAYANLARAAGPEPVWALEKERAGRLKRMAAPVRESMSTGSIAPILAAAGTTPADVGPPTSAIELGAPLIEPWPYTELIREHVEHDWRRLALVDNPTADRPSSTVRAR